MIKREPPEMCWAVLEDDESVTPCYLVKGHDGDHESYRDGKRATWMPEPEQAAAVA